MSGFRIEWCHWQPGVDEADQDWTRCAPMPGVDYTSSASCEAEKALLEFDTAGGNYAYRMVAEEPEAPRTVQKTFVDRWDPRMQEWLKIEVEIQEAS